MDLSVLWFWIVAFLFVGYFVLDGFDFGVGMSLPFLGRDDTDRRVLTRDARQVVGSHRESWNGRPDTGWHIGQPRRWERHSTRCRGRQDWPNLRDLRLVLRWSAMACNAPNSRSPTSSASTSQRWCRSLTASKGLVSSFVPSPSVTDGCAFHRRRRRASRWSTKVAIARDAAIDDRLAAIPQSERAAFHAAVWSMVGKRFCSVLTSSCRGERACR